MFAHMKVWFQYMSINRRLKAAKIEGYGKLETGALYPKVRKKLFEKGFEEYTQGGILSEKRYFWTTAPVAQNQIEQ